MNKLTPKPPDLKPHEIDTLKEMRLMRDGEVTKVIKITHNNWKIKSPRKRRIREN